MKCKECNAEISVDDITMNLNDTDIELIIQCPECEFERGLYVDNNDFHDL